jgi:hypothetical protein
MVALAMVMDHEVGERTPEVSLTQRHRPIQAFLFDGPHKALRMRIAVRSTERCLDHAHTRPLEPKYLHVYSAMARYLTPRWQGEESDWETFAERSADRLGGREGSMVYGHVAWQISKLYRGADFYKQNRVSWDRVKQGFIDREALYGFSLRNLNAFCQLAGAAADRETTRALLARIGDAWDADVWKERKYFEGYRKWAGE